MKILTSYLFCCAVFLLSACNSPKELEMTAEFSDHNRSSEINRRLFSDYLVRLFDYRAFEKKLISSSKPVDSSIFSGIVFPEYWIRIESFEEEMLFGNDSDKCTIHFNTLLKTSYKKRSSLLLDIASKNPPNSSNDQTEMRFEYVKTYGSIKTGLYNEPVLFSYEHPLDQRNINGKLIIGTDSFYIRAEVEVKGIEPTRLLSLSLVKGSVVYAMVKVFPGSIYKRNKIFLYTRATASEQFMIAAYFAIAGRFL